MRFDFIRTARAKGASRSRVLYRHALRNAMIPVVTILALEMGGIFSGALITETVFAYPYCWPTWPPISPILCLIHGCAFHDRRHRPPAA